MKNKTRNSGAATIVGRNALNITVDSIETKYCLICIASNLFNFKNLTPKHEIKNKTTMLIINNIKRSNMLIINELSPHKQTKAIISQNIVFLRHFVKL